MSIQDSLERRWIDVGCANCTYHVLHLLASFFETYTSRHCVSIWLHHSTEWLEQHNLNWEELPGRKSGLRVYPFHRVPNSKDGCITSICEPIHPSCTHNTTQPTHNLQSPKQFDKTWVKRFLHSVMHCGKFVCKQIPYVWHGTNQQTRITSKLRQSLNQTHDDIREDLGSNTTCVWSAKSRYMEFYAPPVSNRTPRRSGCSCGTGDHRKCLPTSY